MKASVKAFVEATSMEAFAEAFVEASEFFFMEAPITSIEASMEAVEASTEAFMSFRLILR